jgi:antitoxin PrlF
MPIARSRVTAQGQISVPADVRRKLGVGPGSVLEWDEEDAKIVVRRAGRFSFEDIPRTLRELKEGIRQHIKERYARG